MRIGCLDGRGQVHGHRLAGSLHVLRRRTPVRWTAPPATWAGSGRTCTLHPPCPPPRGLRHASSPLTSGWRVPIRPEPGHALVGPAAGSTTALSWSTDAVWPDHGSRGGARLDLAGPAMNNLLELGI